MRTEQVNTQYLLDQVSRLIAENAMLKEKWLAPKPTPLSDREITTNTPKLIHIGERLAFHAGVKWAEKAHGIGVDDE
jgi:hypothetical protein